MIRQILFVLIAAATLHPLVSSPFALAAGMVLGLTLGNPLAAHSKRAVTGLLQLSVIGLGAAMNLLVVAKVGVEGLGYTVAGIAFCLAAGQILGRVLKTAPDTSLLVSVGTAICGGSAIAAVSAGIRAKSEDISVSLATVFTLNAIALLVFPFIGHQLGLSESAFGLWSALAIHDTSSVVGAAMQYGPKALEIATTVKLARALWIIPVTFGIALARKSENAGQSSGPLKKPWFILGFLAAAGIVTFVPSMAAAGALIANIAKRTLVLTLFLIGSGLSRRTLAAVGPRPFIQGVLLWCLTGTATLAAINSNLIHVNP